MTQNGTLTVRQRRFVECLLTARTVTEAATLAVISRRTADRYLNDPLVRAAIEAAQADALAIVTFQVVGAMNGALDTLTTLHRSVAVRAATRVSAATAVLAAGPRLVELVDLGRRLSEIEARLEDA